MKSFCYDDLIPGCIYSAAAHTFIVLEVTTSNIDSSKWLTCFDINTENIIAGVGGIKNDDDVSWFYYRRYFGHINQNLLNILINYEK